MNHVVKKRTEGFTIIELVLAMAFISVLLFAIALTVIQVATIYNKGMTLKEVNQVGRALGSEFTTTVSSSDAFVYATDFKPNADGGRLCLGNYSYVWNYSGALVGGNPGVIRYQSGSEEIHLVKIADTSKVYCALDNSGGFVNGTVLDADRSKSSELLESGDRLLNIHQFALTTNPAAVDTLTGQQMYTLSFTVGTGDEVGQPSTLTPDKTQCLPPGDVNANFAYCAVQQFTLVIRAGNRVN